MANTKNKTRIVQRVHHNNLLQFWISVQFDSTLRAYFTGRTVTIARNLRPDANGNVFSWRQNCRYDTDGSWSRGTGEMQLTGQENVKLRCA